MRVTFYGVRGSTPCNGDDVKKYGGNTSCVGVDVPGQAPILFDMGTGLRYFGARQPNDGTFRGTVLLSHMHWDHTQGLPFFTPILSDGAELDVYGPAQDDGRSVAEVLMSSIRPPLFPIALEQFPGTLRFHDTSDDDFQIGEVSVKARLVPHVGPTLGYRIEWKGRSIAYLSDHQQPYDGSFAAPPGVLELVSGVDLLIHDSQYTTSEFARKSTWGHCTVDYAVWLAGHAGVKRLALFHHDPTRTDTAIDDLVELGALARDRCGVEVFPSAEGLTVEIP